MKSQFEISLDLYKKARQFDPSNVEVHRQLGDVYRKIGQSALAIEAYNVYLELFPNTKHKDSLQRYISMMQ
jgi:Flp pilus assembly protein TadD